LTVLNANLHSPHCRACKERVCELLQAAYADCRTSARFGWPATPQAYAETAIGAALVQIHTALGGLRGHRDFIKSAELPPCDYFVPDPPFILEFDESQHFSQARLATLVNYPKSFPLGFSVEHWQELCRQIDARDDEPIDRDERRAWYDTLRDLLPTVHGFKPTVRLYAEEYEWCSLDARSGRDVEAFRKLLLNQLRGETR